MSATALSGGFDEPAIGAALAFRSLMEAMARPGTWRALDGTAPPAPLSTAAGAALLTLCDSDTPVFLAGEANCKELRQWLAFHTGAPLSGPADCMFAVGTWKALAPLSQYNIGNFEYPDRSTTLIVDDEINGPAHARLTGPGIKGHSFLTLPETEAFQINHALFPLGLDFIFTTGWKVAALPRTTEVV